MSIRPVRSIDTYYETQGPFAVARDRAEVIHEAAFGLVGQHTGRIAMQSVRGLRIASDASAVPLGRIVLPPAEHTSFITGRRVLMPDGGVIKGLNLLNTLTGVSRTMLHVSSHSARTDAQYVRQMAHETAHGFGLGHCPTTSCAMTEIPTIYTDELIVPPDIFCSPCVDVLERAGRSSRAS